MPWHRLMVMPEVLPRLLSCWGDEVRTYFRTAAPLLSCRSGCVWGGGAPSTTEAMGTVVGFHLGVGDQAVNCWPPPSSMCIMTVGVVVVEAVSFSPCSL